MITFTSDSSGANQFLNSMLTNVSSLNNLLATKGMEHLKQSNKNSFIEQRDPSGKPWDKSILSQIDPTGSPRKTMMRSRTLFDDTQDIANYKMSGNTLQEFTTAQSEKGFLYGEYWNRNRWQFAGIDKENLEQLEKEITDYIFGKR